MRMDRLGVAQVPLLVLLVMLISAWVAVAALPDGEQTGRDQKKGQQRDSAALRTTVDDVDLALVSVSQEEDGEAAEVLIPMTCDRIGDDTNRADNTNIYRGNIYSVTFTGTVLREIKMEFAFLGEIDLHFSIRRASSDAVPQVFSADGVNDIVVPSVGDGIRKLYSTGTINIALEKGFDYAIGVSWTITSENSSVNYFNDSLTYPLPYTHGETLKRVLQNVPPPLPDDHIFTISTTTGAYSMELCFAPVAGACCAAAAEGAACSSVTEEECIVDGSFFHGDRTDCRETPCSVGACCMPCGGIGERGCRNAYTPEACEAVGGSWSGSGVDCVDGLCPKITGACCTVSTCTELCIDECDDLSGNYLGDDSACFPNMCAGACCVPDIGCADLTLEVCLVAGFFMGLGTTCADLPPELECGGACCATILDVPTCLDVNTRAECAPLEGKLTDPVYMGDMIACDEVNDLCANPSTPGFPDVGACCLQDGDCVVGSIEFCNAAGGHFDTTATSCDGVTCSFACCIPETQTDPAACVTVPSEGVCTTEGGAIAEIQDGTCVPDPCGVIVGSCCLLDSECGEELTREDCAALDGRFDSTSTNCAACTNPLGSCCQPSGSCVDLVTEMECIDTFQGTYNGDNTICASVGAQCNLRRACCTNTGGCLLVTREECMRLTDDEEGTFLAEVTTCLEDTCPGGACCLATGGGTCELRREDLCLEIDGKYFQGRQTTCEAGLCTLGACCNGVACTAGQPASECAAIGSEFSPRAVCNNNACDPGACCVDGDCLFETRAFCDSAGGFYQGPNVPCGAGLCDLGRCCMEDADPLCDVVEAECFAASSIPFEASVACGSPLPCEERGACCPIVGSCIDRQLTSQCNEIGGQFTPNTVCGEQGVICPIRGACCSSGTCEEVTNDECETRGGVYQGDGNTCFVGLCTLGSCCVGGGFSCAAGLVTSQCRGLSDIFRPVLDCTVACDLAGACCLTEGVCVDDVLQSVCALHNGSPSPGAPCNAILCLAQGACCGPTGTCTFGTVGECGAASVYLGDGTACGEDSCPTGACCHDGQCDELTESACSDVEGLFDGEGTGCSSDRCDVGGCCQLDGTCENDKLRLECEGALEEFRRFELCEEFCTPRGACCPEVGDCQDRKTQTQCTNDGGSFGGAGSACQADTCDFGGCCLEDVLCRELETLFSCQQDGGTFLGAGVACDLIVACATGACCRPDGFCDADVLGVACAEPNVFNAGSTCEEAACVVFGACCLDDLSCAVLSRTDCLDAGGRFSTTNAVCQPFDFCLPGACCLPGGSCDSLSRRVCDNANGTYLGAGTECGEVCMSGACCQLDGTCDDALMQTECLAGIGDFTVGVDCSQTMCEPRGACCGLSGCTIQTRSECLMNDNTFQGIGIACGADTCSGINNSDPADCTIDARQPTDPDGAGVFGWDSVEIVFDAAVAGLTPASFTVSPPVTIADVVTSGLTARLTFDAPIPPGQWTCITHNGSGGQVCLGYLPGDTDGDEIVSVADIAALVDCISCDPNGDPPCTTPCDLWLCDLDQSGRCGPADLLRGVDLLRGSEMFSPGWLDRTIGTCPSLAP